MREKKNKKKTKVYITIWISHLKEDEKLVMNININIFFIKKKVLKREEKNIGNTWKKYWKDLKKVLKILERSIEKA